ncbi:hypothetical protein SV7mr_40490 [Stieleria bergensis]|uniref:Uncharacterized protein n=1 Tax=Stieleria bergensis TaxID=2528025 RepID=A0A517SZK7_9BACT|nr:hypothetical protein SV7mr_40490 [Planctomycetes bacterium SV_7m_r]
MAFLSIKYDQLLTQRNKMFQKKDMLRLHIIGYVLGLYGSAIKIHDSAPYAIRDKIDEYSPTSGSYGRNVANSQLWLCTFSQLLLWSRCPLWFLQSPHCNCRAMQPTHGPGLHHNAKLWL